MPTNLPRPERGCRICRPDWFPAARLSALHFSWRIGLPVGVVARWGVTLDGVRQERCSDAYATQPGWITRVLDPVTRCSCGSSHVMHERVWGTVEIVPREQPPSWVDLLGALP